MLTPILLSITLIVLFIFGIGVGYLYSTDDEQMDVATIIRMGIAIIVVAMWVAAMAADILMEGYTISPLVHGIMGGIVGYFFASDNEMIKNIRGGGGSGRVRNRRDRKP